MRSFSSGLLSTAILLSAGISLTLGGVCEESIWRDQHIISCKGRNLAVVPNLTSYNQEYDELTLAQNLIERVEDFAFDQLRVKRLDLTDNPIVFLSPNAFQGIGTILASLLISFHSTVTDFPVESFDKLPDLRALVVSRHGFRSLAKDALSGFRQLQNLSLTHGVLERLEVGLFQNQTETLSLLDLQSNYLTAIPRETLSGLDSLRSLNLAQNKITGLDADAFGDLKIEVLDLSTQNLPMSHVDDNAFRSLRHTLKNLSLAYLSLTSQNLQALKQLTSLIDLDLSQNKITRLDEAFSTLNSLLKLNLQDNPITALSEGVFRHARSILILNLASSNISSLDDNAFAGLTSLEDLDLGNSKGLALDERTFRAQSSTLKVLKLQNSNLAKSEWSVITPLRELQDLFLSGCELSRIPEFTFRKMKKLRSIDLKNNRIETLTQRSLAGLEDSLMSLNILGNRIQTMDACVFHGFTKIDLLKLSLQQNPLQCDCGLRWLYVWFLNVTSVDNYLKKRISWSCANLNNANFRDLNDTHFENCDQVENPVSCEEWFQTESTTIFQNTDHSEVTTVFLRIASFLVSDTTHSSITVEWKTTSNATTGFSVTWEPTSGGEGGQVEVDNEVRVLELPGLTSSTQYQICVKVLVSDSRVCLNATTSLDVLRLALICGVAVGGGVALIVLLIAIICCCCCCCCNNKAKSRQQIHVISQEEPKLGSNTKRFQKPPALPETPPPPLMATQSIAKELERLTDEERYKLINLLTHSGGSVASLNYSVRSLPRQRLPPGYVTPDGTLGKSAPRGTLTYVPEPHLARKEYEDIDQDEFYDEISDDEIL